MNTSFDIILSCLCVGGAVTAAAWSGGPYFAYGLDLIERDLADKLRRLRAPTRRLRFYLIAWLATIACVLVGFWLPLGSPVFGVLLSIGLFCGPWYLIRRMAQRRREKIDEQLADAMVMLANSIRAGLSLPQSLDILAAQCPRPIQLEFRQIVSEYNLGKPLEEAMIEAKQRLRSENFALFAAAMMASHQSGGRLNEIVERIAQSVLELQRLERKIKAETAQARKSAVYMAIAPAFILAVYYFMDPDSTKLLFTMVVGQIVLAAALVLNVAAYLWARVILNPDI